MRLKRKNYEIGDTRVTRKFLLLPRSFEKGQDYRWLEFANIKEIYNYTGFDSIGSSFEWVEIGFADGYIK